MEDFRFSGIERLLSPEALTTLKSSHVMVVGLGGVGSWAAEALVRTGLGEITLIDYDENCLSNTNRQLQVMESTVGQLKVESLAERFQSINPDCRVHLKAEALTADNARQLLSPSPDVVIDAIDSLKDKIAIALACRGTTPLVCSGGAGGMTDPTRIKTADLSRCYGDRLLQKMRKRLRQVHGFPSGESKKKFGIDVVFSEELPECTSSGPLDCNTGFGTATYVTGVFGFFASHLAVRNLMSSRLP